MIEIEAPAPPLPVELLAAIAVERQHGASGCAIFARYCRAMVAAGIPAGMQGAMIPSLLAAIEQTRAEGEPRFWGAS